MKITLDSFNLTGSRFWFVWALSCLLAALAQPTWLWYCGPLAGAAAYGVAWLLIASSSGSWKLRFWRGFSWFFLVQGFQWSWFAAEQFQGKYIYGAFLLLLGMWAFQFGVFCVVLGMARLRSLIDCLALAALWTVMEWMRLYVFTGSTLNPIGMALTCTSTSIQFASIFGIYGLCFWVAWVNLLLVRSVASQSRSSVVLWLIAALLPYLYGLAQVNYHASGVQKAEKLNVLLAQTATPPVPFLDPLDRANLFDYALRHWQMILGHVKEYADKDIDLIVLPESAVPYGTYFLAYTHESVAATFEALFGVEGVEALPPLKSPKAELYPYTDGDVWLVSNAYWSQALANLFAAEVVIGLEHHQEVGGEMHHYNSALRLLPHDLPEQRYDKMMLLPMGEYIPFSWASPIAALYGISGSFTSGKGPDVYHHPKIPYGISICYEETFSEFVRKNRALGAELLVNITSDVWYPHTRLPSQHFEHGRLRTVENGVPLVRACNTGVTAAVDCLGRDIASFGDENGPHEWKAGALYAEVPLYDYSTLYSRLGDRFVIGSCFFFMAVSLLLGRRARRQ